MVIEDRIKEALAERGAVSVGIANRETLADGPPSAQIDFALPGARSAISFALLQDREKIRAFLAKEDRLGHDEDNTSLNFKSFAMATEVAEILKKEGHQAVAIIPNGEYRQDQPDWRFVAHPPISHRYMAVASGVGFFGWSGNVGIKGHGANVLLGTCITTAELEPTPPVAPDESFCDNCKMCAASCPMEMFEKEISTTQTIGGNTYVHAARRSTTRCLIGCGSASGMHKSGEWSSWSPGRFTIPDDEMALRAECSRLYPLMGRRPSAKVSDITRMATSRARNPGAIARFGGFRSCSHCQIICFGDKTQRAANLKLLHTSGCIVQEPDGALVALPPDEAAKRIDGMDPDRKALYV